MLRPETPNVLNIKAQYHETEAGIIIEPVGKTVQAAIDEARDHLRIVTVGIAVEALAIGVTFIPVPDGRKTLPRICVDEIRIGNEVGRIKVLPFAPFVEGSDVISAGHWIGPRPRFL